MGELKALETALFPLLTSTTNSLNKMKKKILFNFYSQWDEFSHAKEIQYIDINSGWYWFSITLLNFTFEISREQVIH